MNRSLLDAEGAVLAVSQFTLYGDARGQRRPSFIQAAPPEQGKALYEEFVRALAGAGSDASQPAFFRRTCRWRSSTTARSPSCSIRTNFSDPLPCRRWPLAARDLLATGTAPAGCRGPCAARRTVLRFSRVYINDRNQSHPGSNGPRVRGRRLARAFPGISAGRNLRGRRVEASRSWRTFDLGAGEPHRGVEFDRASARGGHCGRSEHRNGLATGVGNDGNNLATLARTSTGLPRSSSCCGKKSARGPAGRNRSGQRSFALRHVARRDSARSLPCGSDRRAEEGVAMTCVVPRMKPTSIAFAGTIRAAQASDHARMAELAGQLSYPSTPEEIARRLQGLQRIADAAVFVAELGRRDRGVDRRVRVSHGGSRRARRGERPGRG